jgi:hypothetical protein
MSRLVWSSTHFLGVRFSASNLTRRVSPLGRPRPIGWWHRCQLPAGSCHCLTERLLRGFDLTVASVHCRVLAPSADPQEQAPTTAATAPSFASGAGYDVDDGPARPLHRPDHARSSRTTDGDDAMQTPRTVTPACRTTSSSRSGRAGSASLTPVRLRGCPATIARARCASQSTSRRVAGAPSSFGCRSKQW